MDKMYLEVGEVVTTHGITGELRVYPWSDDVDFLTQFKRVYTTSDGGGELKIISARSHKNVCLLQLEGIDSIPLARHLIGKVLYINRNDIQLEEGRYFVQDLLGLRVVDKAGTKEFGTIKNITHPGRHDVYEIKRPDGTVCLFPAVSPFLVKIDLAEGLVWVDPIEGMFEEEKDVGDGE